MSQGINAGFARSEQLKAEWETLRSEILSLPSDNPANIPRRTAIHARMSQITADMSAVLSETRKLIPTPDIDADTDEGHGAHDASSPFIQYSKNHLHIIQRTYESSDSEDGLEEKEGVGSTGVGEEDVPEAPVWHGDIGDDEHLDVDELRDEMRDGKEDKAGVIVVEGKGAEKGLRVGLGELKLKLKDRLKMDNGGGVLSEEERESLTLEQSRLEREVRRMKRLGAERTRHEDKRLEEMITRIGKIREKLGDATEGEGLSEDEKARGLRSVAKMSQRLERRKTVIFGRGPKGEKKEDGRKVGEGIEEGTTPSKSEPSATESEKSSSRHSQGQAHPGTNSKRKKGWLALEAGVASIRVLGRNLRGGGKTREKEGAWESGGHGAGVGKDIENGRRGAAVQGNAFAETAQKMHERGEKLGSTAEGADQMAKDAGDMLAAVRALRQKNQRGGFFS